MIINLSQQKQNIQFFILLYSDDIFNLFPQSSQILDNLPPSYLKISDFRSNQQVLQQNKEEINRTMDKTAVQNEVLSSVRSNQNYYSYAARTKKQFAPQVFSLTNQCIQLFENYKKAMQTNEQFVYSSILHPNMLNLVKGTYLQEQGEYQEAIKNYQKFLGWQKSESIQVLLIQNVWYNLGVCHEKLGQLESAKRNYKCAMQKNFENEKLIKSYTNILIKLGEQDKIDELKSKLPFTYKDQVIRLCIQHKFNNAVRNLKINQIKTSKSIFQQMLMQNEVKIGEQIKIKCHINLAKIHESQKEYEKALEMYKKGLQMLNELSHNINSYHYSIRKLQQKIKQLEQLLLQNKKNNFNNQKQIEKIDKVQSIQKQNDNHYLKFKLKNQQFLIIQWDDNHKQDTSKLVMVPRKQKSPKVILEKKFKSRNHKAFSPQIQTVSQKAFSPSTLILNKKEEIAVERIDHTNKGKNNQIPNYNKDHVYFKNMTKYNRQLKQDKQNKRNKQKQTRTKTVKFTVKQQQQPYITNSPLQQIKNKTKTNPNLAKIIQQNNFNENNIRNKIKTLLVYDSNYNITSSECEAYKRHQKTIKLYKKQLLCNNNKDTIMKIIDLYNKIGMYQKAISFLKTKMIQFRKEPEIYYSLGWMYLKIHDFISAIDYLEKAQSLDPYSLQIKTKLAHVYYLTENKDKLKIKIRELMHQIQKYEGDQCLKVLIALFLQEEGEIMANLKILQQLHHRYPDNYNYLYLMARSHIKIKSYPQAFKYLQFVLQKHPNNFHSLLELSGLYAIYGNYKRSEQILKKCLMLDQNNEQALTRLTKIYEHNKQYKKAVETYLILLKQRQKLIWYMKIGDCYNNMYKHNKALYFYKKGMTLDNRNPILFTKIADLYLIQENYQKALFFYQKYDEVNDGKENDQVKLGKIQCKIHLQRNFQFYLQQLRYLQKNFKTERVFKAIAFCLYNLKRYKQAINYYFLLNEMQEKAQNYFNIGLCYQKLGKYKKSQKYYLQMLQKNPDHSETLFNLGILYYSHLKHEDWQIYLKKAIQIQNNQSWKLILGEIYLECSKYQQCFDIVQSILNQGNLLNQHKQKMYEMLVKCQDNMENTHKITSYLQKLKVEFPHSHYLEHRRYLSQ